MQTCSTKVVASGPGSCLGGGKHRCEHIIACWGAQEGTPPPLLLLSFPAQQANTDNTAQMMGNIAQSKGPMPQFLHTQQKNGMLNAHDATQGKPPTVFDNGHNLVHKL